MLTQRQNRGQDARAPKREFRRRWRILRRCIFGIEIDPAAARRARIALARQCLKNLPHAPRDIRRLARRLKNNIRTANALRWLRPESMQPFPRQFDLVIGNPPYVRWGVWSRMHRRLARRWRRRSRLMQGRPANLYVPFVELGMRVLRPGGTLAFWLPWTFTTSDAARGLRAEIARRGWLRRLVRLRGTKHFRGADVEVGLLQLRAAPGARAIYEEWQAGHR